MRIVATLMLLALASGCATPMPHVTMCYWAPLAHPTMTTDEISEGIDHRVYAVSEGATGRLGRN